jgi:ATP-binding cassette subfamily F protein 3
MLDLESVRVQLGEREVLAGVSLRLHDRDRVALVGRNGAGKSTLLRVAAGLLVPDGGAVRLSKDQQAALLRQDHVFAPGRAVRDEAAVALAPVLKMEERAQRLRDEAAGLKPGDPRQAELLHEAGRLHDAFLLRGGYRADAEIGRVLRGLGFGPHDDGRDAASFSGGWQVRIALACLLLRRPDVLLLDEPTNHLDLETRTWLLHELRVFPGSVVIVSHDRDFLDRLVTRTVEIVAGRLDAYAGGYTAWLAARSVRREALCREAADRAEERARLQAFVDRFRAKPTKAAQAQSRLKMLEKLPPIEVPPEAATVRMTLPVPAPVGTPAVAVRHLAKRYGDNVVFGGVDAVLLAGQRAAVVGPNGAGKSTLLRLLAGRERPDGGYVETGPGARLGYFAQDARLDLDETTSVLAAAASADPLAAESKLRASLGAFLFVGDDVHKPLSVLSGGERSRLALLRVFAAKPNVLILDEPTNHLDIETKDALARALADFPGTAVFVSHDRAFADAVANCVWEVGGGRIATHSQGFEAFLWDRARDMGLVGLRASDERAPDDWLLRGLVVAEVQAAEPAPDDWRERKRLQREREKRSRRLDELLEQIGGLEADLAASDARLAAMDPTDWTAMEGLLEARQAQDRALTLAMAEWERLSLVDEAGTSAASPGS